VPDTYLKYKGQTFRIPEEEWVGQSDKVREKFSQHVIDKPIEPVSKEPGEPATFEPSAKPTDAVTKSDIGFTEEDLKRTFSDNIGESYKRRETGILLDIMAANVAEGTANWDDYLKQDAKLQKLNTDDPIEFKNLFQEMVVGATGILPGWVEGLKTGMVTSLALAAGTVAAGVPIAAVPAVAVGMAAGTRYFWWKQGKGAMYAEMRKAGIDHEVANLVSAAGAIPYALIEGMQVGRMTPGLRKSLLSVAKRKLVTMLAKAGKKGGVNYARNVAEEMAQKGVSELAFNMATEFNNKTKGTKIKPKTLQKMTANVLLEGKEAAKSMALLPIPGAVADIQSQVETRGVARQEAAKQTRRVEIALLRKSGLSNKEIIRFDKSDFVGTGIFLEETVLPLMEGDITEEQALAKVKEDFQRIKVDEVKVEDKKLTEEAKEYDKAKTEVQDVIEEKKPKTPIEETPVPRKRLREKELVARIKKLKRDSAKLNRLIREKEKRRKLLSKMRRSTTEIDGELDALNDRYILEIESEIADIIITPDGKVNVNALVEFKVKDIRQIAEAVEKRARREGVETTKKEAATKKDSVIQLEKLATAVNKMINRIKTLPTKGLPIDYKDKINEIKSNLDFKTTTPKSIASKNSMKAFIDKARERGEATNIPSAQLELLEKVTVADMELDDLVDIYEVVTRIHHQGKLKGKLLTTQADRKFSDVVTEGTDTITKSEGVKPDSLITKWARKLNKGLIKKSTSYIKKYLVEHLRPELMIKMLDDLNPGGINVRTMLNPLLNAERKNWERDWRVQKIYDNIYKDIDAEEAMGVTHEVGRFKGEEAINRDTMLFIYAASFDPDTRRILEASGVTEQDIKDVTEFLSPADKKAVKKQFEYANKHQWAEIDAVYSELEGVHMDKVEFHFPIMGLEDAPYNEEIEQDMMRRRNITSTQYIKTNRGSGII